MAPDMPSNIRVFVRWQDQTVFAGEEVRCTVTFKNVTSASSQQKQPSSQQPKSQGERQRLAAPLHARAKAGTSYPPSTTTTRGHRRSALSLNMPPSNSHSRAGSLQFPQTGGGGGSEWRPGHNHKRSLSIVSIGSNSTVTSAVEDHSQRHELPTRPQLSRKGHGRAASLQINPHGRRPSGSAPQSATYFPRHTSSPLYNASYPPDRFGRPPGTSTVPPTPGLSGQRRSPRSSPSQMPEFRFPAAPPATAESAPGLAADGRLSPRTGIPESKSMPLRSKDHGPSAVERPAARILASNTIPGGTPRSSGEFYPVSNHSSETLVSEYVTQPANRVPARPPHARRSSGLNPSHKGPESLMMGYAQIQGSFSLDGSLVSLSPFEQVKKKGTVGGAGGGVVGLEPAKRETGLLRGFGWSNISTSLGDLLGGGELSTIKEMRGAANSKSIPLLSTPQSVLFVDLQLGPGESRSYEYSFKLPKGLPPSHRGKTIKIAYSLVVGTQRAGGAREQQVRSVEIPFRVLGSVNSYGEILGHDLMSPYILLRDKAVVKNLGKHSRSHKPRASFGPLPTMNEFLAYVDELATRPRDESSSALLSPTETMSQRRPSALEEATTAKEAIDLAIMRSNLSGDGQQSANRFEIARNGQRVGVVMLTRPAFRLGEMVTMAIDFTDADIPCYAVHATLETTETVESSLAVRSESSLQRVTRKVYASSSEATLYSRRIVFTPTIPVSATPEFMTTGISLEWRIRVEFVVPFQGSDAAQLAEPPTPHPLLEQISQDEKGGLVLVAMENLACESFDVSVPLRVYGAVGRGLERLERDEASEEGLAV